MTIFLLLMKIESSLCTVKDIFAIFRVLAGVQMLNKAAKAQAVIGDITYCIPVNMSAYALFCES